MATSISIKSLKEYYVDEQYPKIYLEKIPSIMLEYPLSKPNKQGLQSRHNLRYRTQFVTLPEIYETDEENKTENSKQDGSKEKVYYDYGQLDYLTLAEDIRRIARKKVPLKNFLERQRLKTTSEEFNKTDAN